LPKYFLAVRGVKGEFRARDIARAIAIGFLRDLQHGRHGRGSEQMEREVRGNDHQGGQSQSAGNAEEN
jgi:hypothetical protein